MIIYDDVVPRDWMLEYYLGHSDPKGEKAMENGKTFTYIAKCNGKWYTQADAEDRAKQYTANNGSEYVIVQAVSQTKVPVPEIELVKI